MAVKADSSGYASITGTHTDWPSVWRDLVHHCVDVIEGKRMREEIEAGTPAQRVVERNTCAPQLG